MVIFSNFYNTIKQNSLTIVGKVTGFISAATFGLSASGFIIEFASYFNFSTSSPLWVQSFTYTVAGFIGLNAGYRIWNIVKIAAPHGLMLLFAKNTSQEQASSSTLDTLETHKKITSPQIIGTVLSFLAGATYGGLVYLGCSHILPLQNPAIEIIMGTIIISTNTIANGAVFSFAWIQNLRNNTLISWYQGNNRKRIFFDIVFSILALIGLGSTMSLGALGLARSTKLSNTIAYMVGYSIALIGFLGEAPFAIKQGQLLVTKLQHKFLTIFSNDINVSTSSIEPTRFSYANNLSLIVYSCYSFCATFVDIGNYSTFARVPLALGSTYLSLISCLENNESNNFIIVEDEDENKDDNPPSTSINLNTNVMVQATELLLDKDNYLTFHN